MRASAEFLQRHVIAVEYFQPPHPLYFPALRIVAALAGVALIFVLRPIAMRASAGAIGRVGLALVLALAASEGILRILDKPDLEAPHPRLESRLGTADPRLGWTLSPRRTTNVQGIAYAIDAFGDRAVSEGFREDPDAPAIILAGESVAYSHGLAWNDSIAARLGAMTGAQVIVTAVGGYGNDQAYLRAMDALARLHKPVAIVTFTLPVQLSRNLHDYRPRLALEDGALVAKPAVHSALQLRNLFANEFRYTSEGSLQRSLALTHAIFVATQKAAEARGAKALFVEPLFDIAPPEVMTSLLADFPHAIVRLGRAQILPGDGHPNADGAKALARAIADALGYTQSQERGTP
jgi:hypothetical protein